VSKFGVSISLELWGEVLLPAIVYNAVAEDLGGPLELIEQIQMSLQMTLGAAILEKHLHQTCSLMLLKHKRLLLRVRFHKPSVHDVVHPSLSDQLEPAGTGTPRSQDEGYI
jgi:hypothetical protein